ncbi:hypothetical protein [Nitratidesulfovibrio termitidis]|uniref:hypothetical protein n=1 Tax=Nitratidesulfovibrio termitidis TaxID=42252 RepID=UPI00040B3EEF|nr:hypothetical protein [Nitratidesulfovibrio termitidis]
MAGKENVATKPTDTTGSRDLEKRADAAGLTLVGSGTWRYHTTDDDEEAVRSAGYFDHCAARYGMRPGDVVLVNARGAAFMVGI